MDTLEKLNYLQANCKCGISIEINNHKNYYITVKQDLKDRFECFCNPSENVWTHINNLIGKDIVDKMIETDSIVSIHFYPNTPIGYYELWHYSLEGVLDLAIEALESNKLEV